MSSNKSTTMKITKSSLSVLLVVAFVCGLSINSIVFGMGSYKTIMGKIEAGTHQISTDTPDQTNPRSTVKPSIPIAGAMKNHEENIKKNIKIYKIWKKKLENG